MGSGFLRIFVGWLRKGRGRSDGMSSEGRREEGVGGMRTVGGMGALVVG